MRGPHPRGARHRRDDRQDPGRAGSTGRIDAVEQWRAEHGEEHWRDRGHDHAVVGQTLMYLQHAPTGSSSPTPATRRHQTIYTDAEHADSLFDRRRIDGIAERPHRRGSRSDTRRSRAGEATALGTRAVVRGLLSRPGEDRHLDGRRRRTGPQLRHPRCHLSALRRGWEVVGIRRRLQRPDVPGAVPGQRGRHDAHARLRAMHRPPRRHRARQHEPRRPHRLPRAVAGRNMAHGRPDRGARRHVPGGRHRRHHHRRRWLRRSAASCPTPACG